MTGRRDEPTNTGPGNHSQTGRDSASIPDSAQDGRETAGAAFARVMRQAAPMIAASSTLTAALLAGTAAGWWLDRHFGTRPWLTLAGVLLGAGAGLYQLARVALKAGKG